MPPFIHCIRHAQALHNVHQEYHLHDPVLTELGYEQCKAAAATELGDLDQIELILASPMIRTIETALALFPAYTKAKKQILLLPDLQEVDTTPCATGSSREYLESKYGSILDYSFVTPDWTDKTDGSRYSPQFVEKRAARTRLLLQAIAQTYADKAVNIVVVSHGVYLEFLTENETFFKNVERRTYVLNSISGDSPGAELLETPCSIARRTAYLVSMR
ncbi:phosphoglycerate mutase-like protein [Xylaria sp. FL1042]|nr:phosphoglycerate mutase-like protein [Xylaria sp. FL1042]